MATEAITEAGLAELERWFSYQDRPVDRRVRELVAEVRRIRGLLDAADGRTPDEAPSYTCEGCGRAIPCRHCTPVPLEDPDLLWRITDAVDDQRFRSSKNIARAVVAALKDGGE